jgi:hypothetical protein
MSIIPDRLLRRQRQEDLSPRQKLVRAYLKNMLKTKELGTWLKARGPEFNPQYQQQREEGRKEGGREGREILLRSLNRIVTLSFAYIYIYIYIYSNKRQSFLVSTSR